MKNGCHRYKIFIFLIFLNSLNIVKSQCCYQTIKEQYIYNSLSDHKWWPRLPSNMAVAASQTWKLVKKSVKNRKLLNKLDSSPLKPFGQMNRNLIGSIYGKSSVTNANFVPIHWQKWLPQTILVSDWLISKKSSPLKPLCQMNRNLVGSI